MSTLPLLFRLPLSKFRFHAFVPEASTHDQ
nr:MAG TPA: hypothetical protein [Caudoviricetes sp.]